MRVLVTGGAGFIGSAVCRRLVLGPNASKAHHELGWKPSKTFEEGIAQTVQWYLGSRTWWDAPRFNGYGGTRLGLPEMQH